MTIPILLLVSLIFCTALSYLVITAILKGPRLGAAILGVVLAVVLFPMVAFAATGAPPPAPSAPGIGTSSWLIGALGGLLGLGKLWSWIKSQRSAWEDQVLAAAAREAYAVAGALQKKVFSGVEALERWLPRWERWIVAQGKKLPLPGALRDKAIHVAHDVFLKAEVAARHASSAAADELAAAAQRFQDALPALKRSIDSFPKGTPAKLPLTATGEISK